jgi:hypothetical protein
MTSESGDLAARIARLEAYEQIRQLASRYALALDSRDMEMMATVFAPEVRTRDGKTMSREAFKNRLDAVLRHGFSRTFHIIGNHIIDLIDEDHARGVVYCRPEHEVGELWVVMPITYWDEYVRVDGRWYFAKREVHVLYAADVLEHPLKVKDRFHFPDNPTLHEADLPEAWPTWNEYWKRGMTHGEFVAPA